MKPYFETLSISQVIQMYQNDEISKKCLDKIADKIAHLDKSEYDLVDVTTFIGVVIDGNVYHFNKFLT